jgi:hypothetical protein
LEPGVLVTNPAAQRALTWIPSRERAVRPVWDSGARRFQRHSGAARSAEPGSHHPCACDEG